MSIKTTLHNCTDITIDLKAGNNGIFRTLGSIPPEKDFVVHSNANETYKEYWCALPKHEEKVILSSDDCMEWQVINIKHETEKKIVWSGVVARNPTDAGKEPAADTGEEPAADAGKEQPAGVVQPFWRHLSKFIPKSWKPHGAPVTSNSNV